MSVSGAGENPASIGQRRESQHEKTGRALSSQDETIGAVFRKEFDDLNASFKEGMKLPEYRLKLTQMRNKIQNNPDYIMLYDEIIKKLTEHKPLTHRKIEPQEVSEPEVAIGIGVLKASYNNISIDLMIGSRSLSELDHMTDALLSQIEKQDMSRELQQVKDDVTRLKVEITEELQKLSKSEVDRADDVFYAIFRSSSDDRTSLKSNKNIRLFEKRTENIIARLKTLRTAVEGNANIDSEQKVQFLKRLDEEIREQQTFLQRKKDSM